MITSGKFPRLVCFVAVIFFLVGCSSSSYNSPISVAISPQPAYVGSGQTIQFTATVTNDTSGVTWSTSGAAAGTVDAQGNYTAPSVTQNSTATVTAASVKDPSKSASANITVIAPATVATTANAQVALYTISVPDGVSVFIQFSTDTSYNLFTSTVPAPSGGGAVSIFVAGMKGNTDYHMRAVFQTTGTTDTIFTDTDHVFTTSAYPSASLPNVTVTTTSGQTPQPGVELLDLVRIGTQTGQVSAAVTDLSGNVLWAFNAGSMPAGNVLNPIKLLPNGHFLMIWSNPGVDGTNSIVQEVDLEGNVVWSMTSAQLNAALAAATCSGCNITAIGTHHDFAIIPNGHIVLLIAIEMDVAGTNVIGDGLVDLDENHHPVWLWNSFDPGNQDPNHLDVNRHPMMFPDWLHANAVVYSPDDKALMVSLRHQGWVIKVNYNDGAGDGHIMWRLGYQGDFALQSGTFNSVDPADWFNAQHDSNIVSSTSSGTLDVLLFDNGNQRVLDTGGTLCGSGTSCESRVPILHLDENAKTADITFLDKLAPTFSFFGGSARQLANGNVEFAEAASTPLPNQNSAIFEVTKANPPQVVWQMQIAGQFCYRGFRISSLYPGVQW